MKTFLLCEPRYFEVRYVINPWMEGNQGQVDRNLAARQWENLYDALTARAAIRLIEPVEGLPDMVFTANGGFVTHAREAVVSSFCHAERQPESEYFRRFFENLDYRVIRLDGSTSFEGAGDALYDSSGRVWAGYGIRSSAEAVPRLASAVNLDLQPLRLDDPRWYHLDTAFCPLEEGCVMAYAQAFAENDRARINAAFGDRLIWVSDEDAHNFACNAVNVGSDIILNRATSELKAELNGRGFNVVEVDVSEFMKSGGACKCMTLELY